LILAVPLFGFIVWESVSEVKKVTAPSFSEKRQDSLKAIETATHLNKRDKPDILLSHSRKDSHSINIAYFQKEMVDNFKKKSTSAPALIASKQQKIRQLRERKKVELSSRQRKVSELRRRLLYGDLDQKQRMLVNKKLLRVEKDLKIADSMIDMRIHSIEREINQVKSSESLEDR